MFLETSVGRWCWNWEKSEAPGTWGRRAWAEGKRCEGGKLSQKVHHQKSEVKCRHCTYCYGPNKQYTRSYMQAEVRWALQCPKPNPVESILSHEMTVLLKENGNRNSQRIRYRESHSLTAIFLFYKYGFVVKEKNAIFVAEKPQYNIQISNNIHSQTATSAKLSCQPSLPHWKSSIDLIQTSNMVNPTWSEIHTFLLWQVQDQGKKDIASKWKSWRTFYWLRLLTLLMKPNPQNGRTTCFQWTRLWYLG